MAEIHKDDWENSKKPWRYNGTDGKIIVSGGIYDVWCLWLLGDELVLSPTVCYMSISIRHLVRRYGIDY